MQEAPAVPATIEETGLSLPDLLNLAMKAMYAAGAETPSAVADILKLPHRVVQLLFENAKERKLLDVLGAAGLRVTSELRFALTEKGKQWALDAPGAEPVCRPGAGAAGRIQGADRAAAHHQ